MDFVCVVFFVAKISVVQFLTADKSLSAKVTTGEISPKKDVLRK